MPRGKARRTLRADSDEEQPAPEADETPVEEPAAAEEPAAEPRRRWNFLRRKKDQPEPTATEKAATEEAATEEPADDTPNTDAANRDRESEIASSDQPVGDSSAVESGGEPTESTESPGDEPILVPHQSAGKRLRIAAVAAAGLFVAGGAFAGATVQPVLVDRALVDTKLDIARTAANAITTLWSYTPDNMDSLADRSAGYLTGNFASEYRKFIDSIVATNKQAQVTNSTSVLGTAVETVTSSEATAVVYTNSVATSPVSKNIPSLRYLSYRLEMKRDGGKWRVTRMTTVTTLDLTPKL